MFSIFYAYLGKNSSFRSCGCLNCFCSSANPSQGLRANCVTFTDMKRDSDLVSWPGFWIDWKTYIFWCKSQETASCSGGFIKTKIYCAWQSRDCQNHFWSFLSNTAKLILVSWFTWISWLRRSAILKWASKSLWNCGRDILLLQAVLVWDYKMGQRTSVCKWMHTRAKSSATKKSNCCLCNQIRSNHQLKCCERSFRFLRKGSVFIQKTRYSAWNWVVFLPSF